MSSEGRNFKRILRRVDEELKSTLRIAEVVSFMPALATIIGKLDIQLIAHNVMGENKLMKRHIMKKHDVMNAYFEKVFAEFNLKFDDSAVYVEEQNKEYSDCIWMCWWQGLENAPKIVKQCVASVKKNAGPHKVVIITEDNYRNFVSFPEFIEEKKDQGIITKTHLSDLLRIELLAKYGGLWLDATFFCTAPLDDCFNNSIWTIKRPNYGYHSVACGRFATYSFACDSDDRRVFAIIREYLLQYWNMYDYMVDYLFLDYLIVLAELHSEYVSKKFDGIKPNHPQCDELIKILNQPYDEKIWNEIKKETSLFKLTWKISYSNENNGQKTFFGKLLAGELE